MSDSERLDRIEKAISVLAWAITGGFRREDALTVDEILARETETEREMSNIASP